MTEAASGKKIFQGKLGPGASRGLEPGFGLYKVKSSKGMSVMGGASACGADYSPAGGMFAVDEALFDVVAQVREERIQAARAQGVTVTPAVLGAPMTQREWDAHASPVKAKGYSSMTLGEANERAAVAAPPP